MHRCLRLKNDPGITELSQKALEARKAGRKLHMLKDSHVQHIDYEFGDNTEIDFDSWIPVEVIRKKSSERMFNSINCNMH